MVNRTHGSIPADTQQSNHAPDSAAREGRPMGKQAGSRITVCVCTGEGEHGTVKGEGLK